MAEYSWLEIDSVTERSFMDGHEQLDVVEYCDMAEAASGHLQVLILLFETITSPL